MKTIVYRIWQCTWGILQTLTGLFLFVLHADQKHHAYHGAIVTEWNSPTGISLGMFVFVPEKAQFCRRFTSKEAADRSAERLLIHEYGHTIQSLLLGPLYLIVIGLPSALWAKLPFFRKRRHQKQLSYFSFYTEKWADRCGRSIQDC